MQGKAPPCAQPECLSNATERLSRRTAPPNILMHSPQKPKEVTQPVDIKEYTALPQALTYESPKRVIGPPARRELKPGEIMAQERKQAELQEKRLGILQNEQIRKKLVADRNRNEERSRKPVPSQDDKQMLFMMQTQREQSIRENNERMARIKDQLADGVRARELLLEQRRKEALAVKLEEEKQRQERERISQAQEAKVQSIRTMRQDEVEEAELRRTQALDNHLAERKRQKEMEHEQLEQLARERRDFEGKIKALEVK